MPRYFFHSMDGFIDLDADGTELPDDDAARLQAVIYLGELLKGQPEGFVWDGQALRVKVVNDQGEPIFSLLTVAEGLTGV